MSTLPTRMYTCTCVHRVIAGFQVRLQKVKVVCETANNNSSSNDHHPVSSDGGTEKSFPGRSQGSAARSQATAATALVSSIVLVQTVTLGKVKGCSLFLLF